MAAFTYDDEAYSDIYKFAYGVRPRNDWHHYTPEQKQAEWDRVCRANDRAVQEERDEEERAIQSALDAGAPDRETALRWVLQSEEF